MIQTLSKVTEHQLDTLMDIWLTSNLQAHSFVPSQYWRSHEAEVRAALPQAELTVAITDTGRIVGFVGVQNDYIAGVFVAAEMRNQHIGHRLLMHLKQRYAKLTLSVFEANAGAVRFYERERFVISATRMAEDVKQVAYEMTWKRG